jgi:hypothetical protein
MECELIFRAHHSVRLACGASPVVQLLISQCRKWERPTSARVIFCDAGLAPAVVVRLGETLRGPLFVAVSAFCAQLSTHGERMRDASMKCPKLLENAPNDSCSRRAMGENPDRERR